MRLSNYITLGSNESASLINDKRLACFFLELSNYLLNNPNDNFDEHLVKKLEGKHDVKSGGILTQVLQKVGIADYSNSKKSSNNFLKAGKMDGILEDSSVMKR
jgi:hypothetical protein